MVRITPIYKPWRSPIWKGKESRSLGDLRSPWLLTTYKSWDDPPSGITMHYDHHIWLKNHPNNLDTRFSSPWDHRFPRFSNSWVFFNRSPFKWPDLLASLLEWSSSMDQWPWLWDGRCFHRRMSARKTNRAVGYRTQKKRHVAHVTFLQFHDIYQGTFVSWLGWCYLNLANLY